MSTIHIQGIGDHRATAIESGLDGAPRGIGAYESGLCNKTITVAGMQRRPQVMIIGDAGHADSLRATMEQTIGGAGFDVISVDEMREPLTIQPRHEFTGTFNVTDIGTYTTTPMERCHAYIERQLWNEAVDQRKAEKLQRKRERQSWEDFRIKWGSL